MKDDDPAILLARFALVLVASWAAGSLVQRVRLPRITGHIFAGIACGPHVAGVATERLASMLTSLDVVCLAVIGVAAGAELRASELRKNPRPTLVMTLAISTLSFLFVLLSVVLLLGPTSIAMLRGLSTWHAVAVGSLAGTLAIARSPASAIAVLHEMRGKGPFCSHVMAVTIVKDVLVVVAFALNMEAVALSGLAFHPYDVAYSAADGTAGGLGRSAARSAFALMRPFAVVAASAACGVLAGVGLFGPALKPARQRPTLSRVLRPAYVLVIASGLYATSASCGLEALLICMLAGATAANRRHDSGERERDALELAVRGLMPINNLVFFTSVGCGLRVPAVVDYGLVAAAMTVARTGALMVACRLGCVLVGAPAAHKEVMWQGFVTQAGVALGLIRTMERKFPGWGEDLGSLMVACVVVNLLIGPPLFRNAIVAVGESGVAGGGGGGATAGVGARSGAGGAPVGIAGEV
ncbi:monovalent Cation:Proton antiporter-1 family [Micromonas pusilla CCMP1545]|uniref:Monovalent Cation:Proton antiporter-1 family n=1 Tax=Micromonas pusilla (strain CCMP1545) TaxID=564608 RepID=C1MZU0_MICPC|nr:monovalent Cation:Proton antiporter-1 family [Micromonas pusilla CCMP1545]EEH54661.1 monovalent Cation:Proton antiporter-1 family [Micromonas pusilla CCMP1545]|eukprot:XP_003061011.1 monovalent Cation:Proton antiporter-1 family [Micromonas pusilla CCMP1545]